MRSIMMLITVVTLGFSTLMVQAGSGQLRGQDEPAFTSAVQMWLNGDDLIALQSLSDLAKQGNSAAQILLASIASRSSFHVHVTANMDRKDRIALLRKPGGLSGKSWLTEAQSSEPLALALLQASRIGEKAPAISALVELGEPLTAMVAAQSMLLNGEGAELIRVLQGLDSLLPPEADILLGWALYQEKQTAKNRYAGSARIARVLTGDERFLLSELAWGQLRPIDLISNSDVQGKVIGLSGKVRAWTPVRKFCEQRCADTVDECTATGGVYTTSPLTPRSPLESVIPNEVYWASNRASGDLARSTLDLQRMAVSTKPVPDACYLREMRELQETAGHGL